MEIIITITTAKSIQLEIERIKHRLFTNKYIAKKPKIGKPTPKRLKNRLNPAKMSKIPRI
jgi:hypothetical protein